ncbi:MAG: methyltransferase domain-containing protein [Dehalococcoidia bacterium]|nr:methyltransferase domain-containing protein [Dehalococcoidia bacterium]
MTRDYFNARADNWDAQSAEKDAGKLARLSRRLGLKPGMYVLDIGTGTGVFLPYLLREIGVEGCIFALDIAERMLSKARLKNLSGKLDFLCASAEDVPVASGTCDAVVCYSSFPHFKNKVQALQEIKRVLKKGGRVFICHTSSRDSINRVHRQVPELHEDVLPSGEDLAALLIMAGYTEIIIEETEEGFFVSARRAD